jgi:hypothetical protein
MSNKEKHTPNSFDVLKKMSADNMDIKIAPAENFKRAQTGKKGWGELTIAVDNETLMNLNMTKNYTLCLLVYNVKEFATVQKNCVNTHATLVAQRDALLEACKAVSVGLCHTLTRDKPDWLVQVEAAIAKVAEGPVCCPDCGNEKFISIATLVAQRDALLSENNRLKEELEITQRWHDIKKELPQNKGLYCHIYIPSLNKNTTFKGWYHPKNKVWLTNTKTHTRTNKVTHWKPITLPIAKAEDQP